MSKGFPGCFEPCQVSIVSEYQNLLISGVRMDWPKYHRLLWKYTLFVRQSLDFLFSRHRSPNQSSALWQSCFIQFTSIESLYVRLWKESWKSAMSKSSDFSMISSFCKNDGNFWPDSERASIYMYFLQLFCMVNFESAPFHILLWLVPQCRSKILPWRSYTESWTLNPMSGEWLHGDLFIGV